MKKNKKEITILTLVMLLCILWGYGFGYMSYEEKDNRYDVNLDGKVNEADYMAIKKYIMESE